MLHGKKQNGFGLISFIIKLAIVCFIIVTLLRWIPIYYEHFTVKRVLDNLANNPALSSAEFQGNTRAAINTILERNFSINNASHIHSNNIEISEADNGSYIVHIAYEVRQHFIGNIDTIISFDDRTVVPGK